MEFDLSENGSTLAATLGDQGASVYGPGGSLSLERSPGLPMRIFNGKDCFIVLDQEGSVAWHEITAGRRLALLRIYEDAWFLERGEGDPLTGRVVKHPPAEALRP
jgi:hypothetical protein